MTSPLVVVQLVAVAVLWIVAFVLACRVRRLGDEVIVLLRRNHDLRCDLDRAEQLGEQLAEQLAEQRGGAVGDESDALKQAHEARVEAEQRAHAARVHANRMSSRADALEAGVARVAKALGVAPKHPDADVKMLEAIAALKGSAR